MLENRTAAFDVDCYSSSIGGALPKKSVLLPIKSRTSDKYDRKFVPAMKNPETVVAKKTGNDSKDTVSGAFGRQHVSKPRSKGRRNL